MIHAPAWLYWLGVGLPLGCAVVALAIAIGTWWRNR